MIQLFFRMFSFAIIAVILSCSSGDKKSISGSSDVSYNVIRPLRQDTVFVSKFVADIQAVRHIELRSRVNGYIESVFVDEGSRVKKDQILFKINDLEYKEELLKARSQLKSAEAQLATKQLEYDNAIKLYKEDLISGAEVSIARANLDAAKALVDVAKSRISSASLRLQFTEIRAPFSGVINRIFHREGSLINEDVKLSTLSEDERVFAYFSISERDFFSQLSKKDFIGAEVSLLLPNGVNYSEPGVVEVVEGVFDKETGSIAARAVFDNSKFYLKHGITGAILLKRKLDNALLVPQRSTFEIQDKVFVFVVGDDNIVQAQPITVLSRIGNCYVVSDGLDVDSRIFYQGVQLVRAGQKVSINEISFRD